LNARKHKLGGRQKVVTDFWGPSQIAAGAPLRDTTTRDGKKVVLYKDQDGRWTDTQRLKSPITREGILQMVEDLNKEVPDQAKLPTGVVPPTWVFNDFGDHAYAILGTDELVHTSPNQELEHTAGIHEDLDWSHGCLHLRPEGRDLLEKMNLLKGGVTLNVHAYVKGYAEYGTVPKFAS
jgi:hypothetical protein